MNTQDITPEDMARVVEVLDADLIGMLTEHDAVDLLRKMTAAHEHACTQRVWVVRHWPEGLTYENSRAKVGLVRAPTEAEAEVVARRTWHAVYVRVVELGLQPVALDDIQAEPS